jgi:hypothetical protein
LNLNLFEFIGASHLAASDVGLYSVNSHPPSLVTQNRSDIASITRGSPRWWATASAQKVCGGTYGGVMSGTYLHSLPLFPCSLVWIGCHGLLLFGFALGLFGLALGLFDLALGLFDLALGLFILVWPCEVEGVGKADKRGKSGKSGMRGKRGKGERVSG